MIISPENLKILTLVEIDKLLRLNGKKLSDYDFMPKIPGSDAAIFENVLLLNELSYDKDEMSNLHGVHFRNLNSEQLNAYNRIVDSVDNDLGKMFFVDGYGGTGKTYLWKAQSYRFRSEGRIVLNVASSGIAALLLPGGRTAHSQFSIPMRLDEESCCKIPKVGHKAYLLRRAALIIWDEAPMMNRLAFEAFDKTLQDIMTPDCGDSDEES